MIHLASASATSNLSQFDSKQVQPNAIDLKVDKIFEINQQSNFLINEDEKMHRGSLEMHPDENDDWHLDVGTYEIIMEGEITIGPDEAGWVITRSTLNRNGLFITSGLYDSGYQGVMAGQGAGYTEDEVLDKMEKAAQSIGWTLEDAMEYAEEVKINEEIMFGV